MKATILLIVIAAVLYGMKIISFDLPLLKKKYAQFIGWRTKTWLNLKTGFEKFIDLFNKKA
jgi:hypothetical protein